MRIKILLAALLLTTLQPAMAEPSKVILVLDASGSMAGKIHGRSKMEIARESVSQVVNGLGNDVQLGLMVYGHRRKGDCEDIELLIPPGPVDRAAFLAKVNALSPLGNTPLTRAVEMAATALKYEEHPATVILVSDGLETCGGDPCEMALKLEAAGLKFTTHVVAFDLTQQEILKIRCLADKTGGMLLRASDAGSLVHALKSAVESAQTAKSGASFLAKNARTGEPLEGGAWKVYKTKGDATPQASLDQSKGSVELPAGTYVALATYKSEQVEVPFEVKEGQMQPVEASFGPGSLRLLAQETPDSPPLTQADASMFWTVVEIKEDGTEGQQYDRGLEDEPNVELPAGTYRVKFSRGMNVNFGAIEAEELVKLGSGEVRTVRVIAAAGVTEISTKWAGAEVPDGAWVEVLPVDASGTVQEDQRRVYARAQPVPALLAPGTYEARSELGAAKVASRFSVSAGQKGALVLEFNAGRLEVKAMVAGSESQDARWWNVYALDASGERVTPPLFVHQDAQLNVHLPVGEFAVTREVDGEESAPVKFKIEKDKVTQGTLQSTK